MSRVKLAVLAGTATFVVCFGTVIAVGMSNQKKMDLPVSEILANLAHAANEMSGEKVAPNIVVRGASIDGDQRLTYTYTVTEGEHVDQKIAREKTRQLQRKVCRDRMMRKAINGGAEIRYTYLTRKGDQLFKVKVTRSGCEKLA